MAHNGIGSNSSTKTLTTEEKVKVLKTLNDLSDSFTRSAAERELVKNLVKETSTDVGISPKLLKKMAKVFHNSEYEMTVEENRDFEETYDFVVGKSK